MLPVPADPAYDEMVQRYASHVSEQSRKLRSMLEKTADDLVTLTVDNPVGLLVVHATMNLYSGRIPRVRVYYTGRPEHVDWVSSLTCEK